MYKYQINALGTVIEAGSNVRVALDHNMNLLQNERNAAFVLEFTLQENGHTHLRQAAASGETGLVLSTLQQDCALQIGEIVDLSDLLRFQPGEIYHPNRQGKLKLIHKLYSVRDLVLELHWSAK